MHYLFLMAVFDRRQDLLNDNSRVLLAEVGSIRYLVKELPSGAELCHQVVTLLILEHLIEPHYIRVVKLSQDVYFLEKSHLFFGI